MDQNQMQNSTQNQLPRGNDGFGHANLYADSPSVHAYDNIFPSSADQNAYDAGWGLNASNYPAPSRVPHAGASSWPPNANHLANPPTQASVGGQGSPYARSLSQSPAQFVPNAYNSYAAPPNYQYRQQQYDPSLVAPSTFGHNFNYATANYEAPNAATIAPQALEQERRSPALARNAHEGSEFGSNPTAQPRIGNSFVPKFVDEAALASAIPKGINGGRFTIINYDELASSTNSERMGTFVNIGKEACEWSVNRAALPAYVPRRSRNDLRKLAATDPKLVAKFGKDLAKKPSPAVPRPQSLAHSKEEIKHEVDSSSEEESSSDEASSYTSESDTEPSPLPSKRPENPKEATEYDTVKALWRPKDKTLSSDSIRNGLKDFWEIVKTIRDRWKADANAVADAEAKNRTNELPLLKSRVNDQRAMIEASFKAALKHGNKVIIELMGENPSLIYLCYQFLLDRSKVDDYNGPLARVMLEMMTLFTTLTEQTIEKTQLFKVLPRYVKKGDAKTQYYAKRISANAAAVTKEKAAAEGQPKKAASANKEVAVGSPVKKSTEAGQVAGLKRPANTAADGGTAKKVATASIKLNGSLLAKTNATVKKPSAGNNPKPTIGSLTSAVRTKPVAAKPSAFFSSLQSAGKKPGTSIANKAAPVGTTASNVKSTEKSNTSSVTTGTTSTAPKPTFSFMETMANLSKPKEDKPTPKQQQQPEKRLPPETPEEKAKRLRKEARRQLHVSFKRDEDLVQIRYFTHDPEEEIGHNSSQMRHVTDVGGEGRMFKQQHQMMDIDEDEETAEETKLIEFVPPIPIDFSVVDDEERKKNYAPYGGGELEPQSAERAVRDHYEANTLMVFYTDSADIPPNPREPADPYDGERDGVVEAIAAPADKYAARARAKKSARQLGMQAPPVPGFDFSKLAEYTKPQQYQQAVPQPTLPSNNELSSLLASLKQVTPNPANPTPPPMGGYGNAMFPSSAPNPAILPTQQPPAPLPPSQPAGHIDLAAILEQISRNQPSTAQTPASQPAGGGSFATAPATSESSTMQTYPPSAQQNPASLSQAAVSADRKQWRQHDPAQNPFFRTKICRFWQEGKCMKGEACSYKHEDLER